MRTEKQIKIIKHAEHNDSQAVGSDKRRTSGRNHPAETKRDAVAIIMEWVSELRRKKAQEAVQGFQSLFGNSG